MSNLPGNPHANDAMTFSCEASERMTWEDTERMILAQQATTHATLTLAYEQRLATLATLFNIPDNSAIPGVDYTEAARQLSEGLGMRTEK